jgi:hypothetical protein
MGPEPRMARNTDQIQNTRLAIPRSRVSFAQPGWIVVSLRVIVVILGNIWRPSMFALAATRIDFSDGRAFMNASDREEERIRAERRIRTPEKRCSA